MEALDSRLLTHLSFFIVLQRFKLKLDRDCK
jgi:hypothetical protein